MKNQGFSSPGGSRGALETALRGLWNALGALLGAIFDAEGLGEPLASLLERSWGALGPKKSSSRRSWSALGANMELISANKRC